MGETANIIKTTRDTVNEVAKKNALNKKEEADNFIASVVELVSKTMIYTTNKLELNNIFIWDRPIAIDQNVISLLEPNNTFRKKMIVKYGVYPAFKMEPWGWKMRFWGENLNIDAFTDSLSKSIRDELANHGIEIDNSLVAMPFYGGITIKWKETEEKSNEQYLTINKIFKQFNQKKDCLYNQALRNKGLVNKEIERCVETIKAQIVGALIGEKNCIDDFSYKVATSIPFGGRRFNNNYCLKRLPKEYYYENLAALFFPEKQSSKEYNETEFDDIDIVSELVNGQIKTKREVIYGGLISPNNRIKNSVIAELSKHGVTLSIIDLPWCKYQAATCDLSKPQIYQEIKDAYADYVSDYKEQEKKRAEYIEAVKLDFEKGIPLLISEVGKKICKKISSGGFPYHISNKIGVNLDNKDLDILGRARPRGKVPNSIIHKLEEEKVIIYLHYSQSQYEEIKVAVDNLAQSSIKEGLTMTFEEDTVSEVSDYNHDRIPEGSLIITIPLVLEQEIVEIFGAEEPKDRPFVLSNLPHNNT